MAQPYFKIFLHNTQILLVDRDDDFLAATSRVLEYFAYKVTTANLGWKARSLLMDKTKKFDILLVEFHFPNASNFTFLHQAIGKGIPTILISNSHDFEVVKVTLQHDALFYLDKPIDVEVLKNLWKHAIKFEANKVQNICVEVKSNVVEVIHENTSVVKEESLIKGDINKRRKRKTYIRWTENLHKKFLEAIHQLGDNYCYPKAILELMNVPGLTRMQVASHLQKCRSGLWCGSKRNRGIIPQHPERNGGKRKYGVMPIFKNSLNALKPYQASLESYKLSSFGNYFGVGHHFDTPSDTLKCGYQLPKMDDNPSFSQVLGMPPLHNNFLEKTHGGRRARN